MPGKIIEIEKITRDMVKKHPKVLFVFGDNMEQRGLGGQAKEMRGELNTVGIPTKWSPSMTSISFFNDLDWNSKLVRGYIFDSFNTIELWLRSGKDVVLPSCGIGTGLAQLELRAPLIFDNIKNGLNNLKLTYGIKEKLT